MSPLRERVADKYRKRRHKCTISNKTDSTEHQQSHIVEQSSRQALEKLEFAKSWAEQRQRDSLVEQRRQDVNIYKKSGVRAVLKEDRHLKNFLQRSINERRQKLEHVE